MDPRSADYENIIAMARKDIYEFYKLYPELEPYHFNPTQLHEIYLAQ